MKNEAFERLYTKYYNEALLYVYSFCHDNALAEDIVETSFFKALRSAKDENDTFKYWLLKVCRNSYFDYVRKRKHTQSVDDLQLSDDTNMLEALIQNEKYIALYNAISLLKGNYQEAIRLFYFDGMSVREIAGITGTSEDNVKVMLFRARKRLKEILEEKL